MYGNINSVHPLDEKPPGVSELRLISYVENDERNVAKLIDVSRSGLPDEGQQSKTRHRSCIY